MKKFVVISFAVAFLALSGCVLAQQWINTTISQTSTIGQNTAGSGWMHFGGSDGGPAVIRGSVSGPAGGTEINALLGQDLSTYIPQWRGGYSNAGGSNVINISAGGGYGQQNNSTFLQNSNWANSGGEGSSFSGSQGAINVYQWTNTPWY